MPVWTFRPIFVLPFGRSGWCGELAVMFPAAMLESSPTSASPMYERCGTFVRAPISEFLISTNVPALAPTPSLVPGRR